MKTTLSFSAITTIFLTVLFFSASIVYAFEPGKKPPLNYNIILDLSDRVLQDHQVQKDMLLIEEMFKVFEIQARRGLILTSKDRFSVKIIPQKGSPLDVNYYENKLQLYLDEVAVKDKNTTISKFSSTLQSTLQELVNACKYGETNGAYFGVDIWSYLYNNGISFEKLGYNNVAVIITDGYFDFENRSHVLKAENRFTSTQFLKQLKGFDWMSIAQEKDYGLIPIALSRHVNWIVSGIESKNSQDILQTKKITYFWEKWLKESGAKNYHFILNSSGRQMSSQLLAIL
ncbi:hypothetical protein BZARG_2640 [Bizionia argentinensis JUB59]|uniref:Uncharacterized protein n=1 Tax=Bizionia argentinensis JUB59 TaxID=1046627 RepID=G2ED97_9FLAO|nr:hypothetical protein [Bizionia argentinensis]EGV43621.1 hypothetical protein BZARG_2640 [Bizionia argentinensis JUB59]